MADNMNTIRRHLVDYTDLTGLYQKQGEIKAQLKHTYVKAVALYNDIRNSNQWSGENKTAMLSFLHLIIQLHGALVGEKMLDSDFEVACNCMDDPRDAFKEARINLNNLPAMSSCLKELEAIQ